MDRFRASVGVLAEGEEVEVEMGKEDIKIDRYRSSGGGGQEVNRSE